MTIAKALLILATDKRFWKGVGILFAVFLIPFILLVLVICSLLFATASHNNAAVDLTFNGGHIPASMPAEYREYITEMRDCFSALEDAIAAVEADMENGDSLDEIRVKAVFYAIYFGSDHLRLRSAAARSFVDCFVYYEECAHPAEEDDDGGYIHLRAYPIQDLPMIYDNVGAYVGQTLTDDDSANITEIYLRVVYHNFDISADVSLEGGNGTHDLIGEMVKDSQVISSAEGFVSPLEGDWRDKVSSEFGYRKNPTGPGMDGHTGLDMAVPMGSSVRVVKAGKVLFVRYKQTGYGYHVAIDHGGGLVTLYAHCSQILVTEGQTVSAGEVIARSGSTGNSTGPHLHLETILDGVPQNPRNYL